MNDLQKLLIIAACRDLITRYAYLNDERNFDALADLFTADATLCRPSAPDTPIVGRENILQALKSRPSEVMTFHVCSDVLIEVQDAEFATARSRILMLSGTRPNPPAATPDPASVKPPLPGTFRDEIVLRPQGWRFRKRLGSLWVQA